MCCKLLAPPGRPIPHTGEMGVLVQHLLSLVVSVGVADVDPSVRKAVILGETSAGPLEPVPPWQSRRASG
mgnify:CR=1 FL=1